LFSFKTFLNETLNTPYRWEEVPPRFPNEWKRYEFNTDNEVKYKVRFNKEGGLSTNTHMSWGMDKDVTVENPFDEENKLAILSTVAEITNHFLDKERPRTLFVMHIENSKYKIVKNKRRFVPAKSRAMIFNKKIKHKDYQLTRGRTASTSIYTRIS